MRCPYLKHNRFCTHCGAFANRHVNKQARCGYKKNPQKCPLIKGTRFEQIFTQEFNKGFSELLSDPPKPIVLKNTNPLLDLGGEKNAKKNR